MRVRRRVVAVFCGAVGASLLAAVGAVNGSSAATTGPVLDNFGCYTASATATAAVPVPFSGKPTKVLLKNSFAPGGFVAAPGTVRLHCAPVQTTVGHSVTAPITNPSAHLVCVAINPKGLKLPVLVTLKNQFGTGALKLIAAQSFCVPSWENGTTPSTFPKANAPSNLGVFVCYTAVHPNGAPAFKSPSSVQLKDRFATVTTAVGAPNVVCVPSTETVNGTTTKLVSAARSSVCFAIPAAKTVTARTVYDKNQFGVGAVKLGAESELCVPSQKAVVTPPTTTTAPTTTTTAVVNHIVTNYTDPSIAGPFDIAAGPDGALWFTNANSTDGTNSGAIGRITTNGVVTSYADSTISNPDSITKGSDGGMWFTNIANNTIGRITTDGNATITNYADSKIGTANRITAGPDGAEWFTNRGNSVGWITSTGGVVTYTDPSISEPQGITTGPDAALWFANYGNNTIGRIATNGTVTNYADPAILYPLSMTAGPDGALWFTSLNNTIGRISTTGIVTNYTDPTISKPTDITTGSDGALWFTNYDNNTIGRITTTGIVTNYTDPTISLPDGITAGPDGAIWFTNTGNNSIGRISL